MMTTDALDPSVVSKHIVQLIEQVTCIECCKYYIAPKTVACGHSLCHSCWLGRRSCPNCGAPLNRKSLRLNFPIQAFTDHVHILSEAFEKLFNVKINEFTLDIPEMQSESDPIKNLKNWLACSENDFSAPVSSQQSQDKVEWVDLSNSKIQVHTVQQKKESPKDGIKKIKNAVPRTSQEDWSKIEILPDIEDMNTKDKENIVGPLDIEPFCFEDNEYTTDHPRRSSRKRELIDDSSYKTRELSVEKQNSKNSGSDSKKLKQNWNNVKKMRKEFSKLNNRNKSKLNVSIEMLKKSQNSSNKPATAVCDPFPKPCYEIDDNTPNTNVANEGDSIFAVKTSTNEKNQKTLVKETNSKCFFDESSKGNTKISIDKNKTVSDNYDEEQERRNNSQNEIHSNDNNTRSDSHRITDAETVKEPVIQNSGFLQKDFQDNCIKRNDVNLNLTTESTDNIVISIKIGRSVTNIVINQNDIKVQVNKDKEVQTSLGPYSIKSKRDVSCSPMQVDNIQNIKNTNKIEDTQIQPLRPYKKTDDETQSINYISTKKNTQLAKDEIQVQTSRPNKKSDDKIDSNKNTESADTATANFKITESVEKELSDIMDRVETKAKDQDKVYLQSANENSIKENRETRNITNDIPGDVEFINELDIFNSGSVKEVNIKSLQSSNKAYSEILVPTMTNKSKKSQKVPDKREREDNDTEMPQNKKQKVDVIDIIEECTSKETNKNFGNEIEHMNYDAIMSQVFANIDADMESKTQSRKKDSNKTIDKDKDVEIHSNKKGTATKPLGTEKDIQQKYSENIFSILDKDSEISDVTNNSLKQVIKPDSTQRRVENLLTPGICPELVSSTREQTQEREVEPMDIQMGTPLVDPDDSDRSVVEETPQKNVSFTKVKQRNDLSKKVMEVNKEKPTADEKALKERNDDSQIIKSIINISDTEDSSKSKNLTVISVARQNKLETPLTINKFVDHIKHNSTPVARKSLNFDSENLEDPEQTLCTITTQEKEFMAKAFEETPKSQVKRTLGLRKAKMKESEKFCLAGSCLSAKETAHVKLLCFNNRWTYVEKYSKNITHLVVGVDEENKSQRSVKYMCALAASKWIVSYSWVEKCLITNDVVDEVPFEALDACGEPGPMLSRVAPRMLFEGMSFYCMCPFTILDVETLKYILEAAGGRVVNNVQGVKVAPGSGPALLLAEPEHTQEDRFIYLAMELSIVPVNYEWVLNCLGSYSLGYLGDLLLCPSTILPPPTRDWPAALMQSDSQDE